MESQMIGRIITIPKGRRFGLTHWYFGKILELMLDDIYPILWIDTVYGNIERYIERAFMPLLSQLDKSQWKWNKTKNEIRINKYGLKNDNSDAYIDFRSADNPENMEGFGYKYVFVNEAGIVLKNKKLWLESVRPMMLDYGAHAILGGTPKRKKLRDGHFHPFYEMTLEALREEEEIKAGTRKPKDRYYQTFNYSTYDNCIELGTGWISKNEIDEYIATIPAALRDQEIYGKFVDENFDSIFKHFHYYPSAPTFDFVLQSWDTALGAKETNDFNSCTTWGIANNKKIYLLNVYNRRVEFPQLLRDAEMLYNNFRPNELLIENKASGKPLEQALKENCHIYSTLIEPQGDKVSRAHSVSPMFEQGQVLIPERATWLDEYLHQMQDFPGDVEHDDMVDSTNQALIRIKERYMNKISYDVTSAPLSDRHRKFSKLL